MPGSFCGAAALMGKAALQQICKMPGVRRCISKPHPRRGTERGWTELLCARLLLTRHNEIPTFILFHVSWYFSAELSAE